LIIHVCIVKFKERSQAEVSRAAVGLISTERSSLNKESCYAEGR